RVVHSDDGLRNYVYIFILHHSISMSVSVPFYFYYYVAHRDLLSFPTRRSSDLDSSPEAVMPYVEAGHELAHHGWTHRMPVTLSRSEEHTSELQSHLNLVCRLLLEKKKKINLTFSHHNQTIRLLATLILLLARHI